MTEIDWLAPLVQAAADRPVALLTGAGISTDSGIPDYRGQGTPPRRPMNIAQFTEDPAYRRRFWAGARIGFARTREVAPNDGHRAIAALEAAGIASGVMTQNVDNLHRVAGTRHLVELHGNGSMIRCADCGLRWTRAEVLAWFDAANPGYAEAHAQAEIAPDGDALVAEFEGLEIPVCPACGGLLRPDVVYFGETVPTDVFDAANDLVQGAGLLLVAGTSLAVNTGIRLVHRAERLSIPLAVINRGPTAIDDRPSVRLRIDAGTTEVLTALAQRLGL